VVTEFNVYKISGKIFSTVSYTLNSNVHLEICSMVENNFTYYGGSGALIQIPGEASYTPPFHTTVLYVEEYELMNCGNFVSEMEPVEDGFLQYDPYFLTAHIFDDELSEIYLF
jgi:hypothetical protein